MFKVHYDRRVTKIRCSRISKHFMFKVHLNDIEYRKILKLFQNISCLRFIGSIEIEITAPKTFQNISCLRFIYPKVKKDETIIVFQNISCLRFIYFKLNDTEFRILFQNISCLRFMHYQNHLYHFL